MSKTWTLFLQPAGLMVGVRLAMVSLCCGLLSETATWAEEKTESPQVLTRVFFQDEDQTVKWADLLAGTPPQLGPVSTVEGFPQLTPGKQKLVQMEESEGLLLVGVRDEEDGAFESGWVLIDTGVDSGEQPGTQKTLSWQYRQAPRVRSVCLDDQQGNPAHLYCYEGIFYLANDRSNGYTRLDPAAVKPDHTPEQIRELTGFHQGGGRHITMAVTKQNVGYSAWMGRSDENGKRVDVTAIKPEGNLDISYSFQLPYGGIHGATYAEGKVFFAPSDGICWVKADDHLSLRGEDVTVEHLPLGIDDGVPLRTGAFTTFGYTVAFVSGRGDVASLHLLDARDDSLPHVKIELEMAQGNRPSGLSIVQPEQGSPLAFVFHDHAQSVEAPDFLSVITLDPDQDGDFSDAQVSKVLPVGRSLVEGHGGHHSIDFDAHGRFAVWVDPGDGSMGLMSLSDCQPIGEFQIGGVPSKLLTVGGAGLMKTAPAAKQTALTAP